MCLLNIIEKYRFGKMIINGKGYTSDLIIFRNYIETNWRRKKGHSIHLDDLNTVLEKEVETLIIGTGKYGLVEVPEEIIKELKSRDIELIIEKSDDAVTKFNELVKKKFKVAGAFHLNC